MDIRLVCPSYKRPNKVDTKKLYPFIRVYVDPAELEAYQKGNPELTIIPCAPGVQGNIARVRNHMLEREFSDGADVVAMIDDDNSGIYYWENKIKTPVQDLLAFIEKYSIVASEWGAKFWGVNVNFDKQSYREYTPFSTLSFVGAPFHVFLKGNRCFYDERLPLKEDYDMTLQQINTERIALRVNKAFYVTKQSENVGGCATMRNHQREMEQLALLQKKWGKDIVKVDKNDRSHKSSKKKTRVDYNPVILVPIKGV